MARKLLLADDSITIQKVVELVLAEEDFEIKAFGNGEDALQAIGSFLPEIVLADIDMPKVNGYQLCEHIKKNPKTSSIPVILLAGAFEPIDEELASKVGADDSVIKPFESQELISKINAALTMAGGAAAEEVSFADVEAEPVEVAAEEETAELAEAEEDLWAMEEDVTADAGAIAAEAVEAVEAEPEEEVFEIAEEEAFAEPSVEPEPPAAEKTVIARREEMASPPKQEFAPRQEFAPQLIEMPSRQEILNLVDKAIRERVAAALSAQDIKEAVHATINATVKSSVEKILWDITPGLLEKMLKEVLKAPVSAISSQVEKVIWETVPDLAATMITKEIERIKSEF